MLPGGHDGPSGNARYGSAERRFYNPIEVVIAFYTSSLGRSVLSVYGGRSERPRVSCAISGALSICERDTARVMWRRGVDRGEIRKEIDGEIVLDLVYGPMVFRLLAGHGSLSDHESEAMVEAIFGGLRQHRNIAVRRRQSGSSSKGICLNPLRNGFV